MGHDFSSYAFHALVNQQCFYKVKDLEDQQNCKKVLALSLLLSITFILETSP